MASRFRDRWRKGNQAIREFENVSALRSASATLPTGYYKVGTQVVFWDGAEFTPYLTENPTLTHGIASDDGAIKIIDVIVFPDVAVDLIFTHAVGPTGMDTGAAWAVV